MASVVTNQDGVEIGITFFGGRKRGRTFEWTQGFVPTRDEFMASSFTDDDGREWTGEEFIAWVMAATWEVDGTTRRAQEKEVFHCPSTS